MAKMKRKKRSKADAAAAELMAGPKKGEVGPVWVKSSPIVSMDDNVSLMHPNEDVTLQQVQAVVSIQDQNHQLHEVMFGKHHSLTIAFAERMIKACNSHGTSLLGLGETKTALAMFKKASEVLGRMPTSAGDYATKLELRCLTYSNLAWFYFCTKQYYPALQYAQKAQSSANVSQDQRAMAAAHLNIGCCVSLLGCHDGGSGANSAVAVCLHNIAVEQIQLYRMGENISAGEALESCTDAIEIAKEVLDPNHAWMRHFRRTFKVAVKMSPSVEALRKSGPLRRVRSASPALFASSKSKSKGEKHAYPIPEEEEHLPAVSASNQVASVPMKHSPLDAPPPAIPPPRRSEPRMAPKGKLPTLPQNLNQPHAFNPSGGETLKPQDVVEDEEEYDDKFEGEGAEGSGSRPPSRASVLGLPVGSSLNTTLGTDLNALVRQRSELIKKTENTQSIPRLMSPQERPPPEQEEVAQEEEGMRVTATSSAAVVQTSIVEDGGAAPEEEAVEEGYEEEFEEDLASPTKEGAVVEEGEGEGAAEEEDYGEEFEEEEESPRKQAAGPTDAEKDEAARALQRVARGKQKQHLKNRPSSDQGRMSEVVSRGKDGRLWRERCTL